MKKFLSVVLTAVMILSFASCGVQYNINVDVPEKKVNLEAVTYINQNEYNQLVSSGEDVSELKEEIIDGETYYAASAGSSSETMTDKQLTDGGMVLDKNKYIMYNNGTEDMGELDESMDEIDFFKFKLTFNKDVVQTNGNLQADKRTVIFDNVVDLKSSIYVFFNNEAVKSKKIKASATGKYTNKKIVKFTADSFISSIALNGKISAQPNFDKDKAVYDSCELKKEGKHKIKVKLLNGYTKTFNFVYDKTAPTVNLKNSKSYKSGTKFTVKDKYGVKTIKLDNKKTKNNQKIKKAGKHTLTMWDNAGNKRVVKFTIKK